MNSDPRTIPSSRRLLGLAMLALLTSGCAALVLGAAGGAAGAVYVMGKLEAELDASVPAVHRATLAGLKDMGLPVNREQSDQMTSHVESQFADGKKLVVNSRQKTESVTAIRIRVGVVGDEERSRRVLDAIKQRL